MKNSAASSCAAAPTCPSRSASTAWSAFGVPAVWSAFGVPAVLTEALHNVSGITDPAAAVRYDQQLWNELASLRFLDAAHGALLLGPSSHG